MSSDTQIKDIGELTAAEAETQLNTGFTIDLNFCGLNADGSPTVHPSAYPENATTVLKLVEVKRLKQQSPHLREDPFVLLFTGSHDQPLYSDMHVADHEVLGRIQLFLSLVNADPGILPERHPEGLFYECAVS